MKFRQLDMGRTPFSQDSDEEDIDEQDLEDELLSDLEDLLDVESSSDEEISTMNIAPEDPSSGESELTESSNVEASKWQKDLWFAKLLPYFDEVEVEADGHLASIKAGLAQAILLRDVRPGLLHWIVELDKYIYLHSRRFSKDDHVVFVKLFFSLLSVPGIEFRMIKTLSHIIGNLLAKRELLSREDLTLPWRPLFDLYWFVCYKNVEEDGLLLLPDQLKNSLETLISHCRTYFPIESTSEILEVVRPYMCPWDAVFARAINIFYLFLPTCLTAEQHKTHGAGLWMDELWFWFHTTQNSPPWAGQVLHLFTRLNQDCPGYVDWSNYYDEIFTHILRNLELQLGTGDLRVQIGHGARLPLDAVAVLVAGMLGGSDNKAQLYVSRLFRAVDGYFHPSNFGRWTQRLLTFLMKLSQAVCQRLHRERHRKPNWMPSRPTEWQLTDAQVEEFVRSVLPCAVQAIFTKVKQEVAPAVIRYLAQLAPKIVVPAVLDKLYPSLETLTEPHRLLQSMNCLVHCLLSLVRDESVEKVIEQTERKTLSQKRRRHTADAPEPTVVVQEGMRRHVFPLLNAVLPGLDPNDMAKTTVTFQVLGLFCALVPLVDCSDAVHLRDDLTQEEKEICSASAQVEEFVELLLGRMFAMVETTAHGHPAHTTAEARGAKGGHTNKASWEEQLLKHGIYSVFHTIARNSSSAIYEVIVNRLYNFVNENVFESRIVASTVAEMVYCVVRTNPGKSLGRFINLLLKKLEENITEETYKEEEVDDTVLWHITLSSQLMRTAGNHLIQFKDQILRMLRLIYPIKCRQIYESSVLLFEHLLIALCSIYGNVHVPNREKLDLPLDQYFPIRHWAEACDRKKLDMKWHVPSEEELLFAQEILQQYLYEELDRLQTPAAMTKEELTKSLAYVKACISGASAVLPLVDGEIIDLAQSAVDMAPFTYKIAPSTLKPLVWKDGSNIRQLVIDRLHSLSKYLLEHQESDTKSLSAVARLFGLLIFYRGLEKSKLDQQQKAYTMSKKIVGDVVKGNKANIQAVVQEMCILHHHKRLLARSGYYFTRTHVGVLEVLVKLGVSSYSDVRKEAQAVLELCFSTFPYCYRFVLDEVLGLLKADPNVSHEQFKGALYILLNGKRQCICVRHTWKTLSQVWPALITAQHSEKPSVVALLEQAQDTVIDNFESFQIRLEVITLKCGLLVVYKGGFTDDVEISFELQRPEIRKDGAKCALMFILDTETIFMKCPKYGYSELVHSLKEHQFYKRRKWADGQLFYVPDRPLSLEECHERLCLMREETNHMLRSFKGALGSLQQALQSLGQTFEVLSRCSNLNSSPSSEESGNQSDDEQSSSPTISSKRSLRPALVYKRRLNLPARPPPPGTLSKVQIVKDIAAGTKTQLPLNIYEPLSMLQVLCELLTHSHLVVRALQESDPLQRMALVAAFVISGYSGKHYRSRKPFQVTGECLNIAKQMFEHGAAVMPSEKMMQDAINTESKRNDENERLYYKLINDLVSLSTNGGLHWRHEDLAQSLVSLLIRCDMKFPEQAVRLFIRLLTHDSLKSRRMSVAFLGAWLKMSKPAANKISCPELVGDGGDTEWPIKWGFRRDLKKIMYREELLPKNKEQWESTVFVDKTHWGVYTWPKKLLVYAPSSQQVGANRSSDLFSDSEKWVAEAFCDEEFVQKFVALNSLEEKKGEDMFNPMTYSLFKGLFRNYNDYCLSALKPVVEKLTKSEKEGEQRLAAEMVAGILQGSRLWHFEKLSSMWTWLRPVLLAALENVNNESAKNWGSAVATIMDSRDPRRMHWLVELLFELCRKQPESSFHAATRLFLLQGALNQVEWRVTEQWESLLDLMRPSICQTYQNLRTRMGSCLTTISWFDLVGMTVEIDDERMRPASVSRVLEELSPKLEILWDEVRKTPHSEDKNSSNELSRKDSDNNLNSTERREAILLLKTLLCFFASHFVNGYVSMPASVVKFLPLLCYFENETSDDELKRDAHLQLRHGMARALVFQEHGVASVLEQCHKVCTDSEWWKSKVSLIRFVQVAVFSNYFFYSTEEHKRSVRAILDTLLHDQRLEVRQAAAETLSGFIMCGYFGVDDALLNGFRVWSRKSQLTTRHAGVLALLAIVQAFPYSVPDFVPNVLMEICPHASDPQPIQATVKKGLAEFKRTHQDSWHEHKELFTDDQLAVLTDLLVSPSYYV